MEHDASQTFVMPNVRDIFVDNGVYFSNAFVTNPTCCPSRASQQSGGFYSHNTGVLTNTWPNGGALRFDDENALAVRMKDTNYIPEAYYTVLIGKYMNGYEDLLVNGEKARYIPPGWDLFIVVSDPKDWDRDYKITIGGNAGPAVGVILPDDICDDVNNQGVCSGDNWQRPDPDTPSELEQKLIGLGVPTCVIERLKAEFPRVGNENDRDYTYLPELEQLLAEAFLEGCAEDPDWEVPTPLFAMLTMAPPHGPTQLTSNPLLIHCNQGEDYTCDDTEVDYTAGINNYGDRGFGEGVEGYEDDDISDKPSWMQGNPDAFIKYVEDADCPNCLLHCWRGTGCDIEECPENPEEGVCVRPEHGDSTEEKARKEKLCREAQQVFKDELAALHIVDCIVKSLHDAAPDDTVFFFTSDHGTMWGEHGSFQKGIPYEEAIRVPFAVAGEGIRTGVEVGAMIAMDLDMPATILEIAGYTRNEISNPGAGGLIESDGCSLLGILQPGASWGSCYTSAPSGLLPRSQLLIQSFRNLAPNATPNWAGLRLEAVGSVAQRKFVLTDTLEEEYYDLNGDDFELANLMHTDPPSDLGDLRTELTDSMGIAIVPNPRTADWNLPIAKAGEPYPYTINFSAIGGSGNYEWCLWDFTSDPFECEGEACNACDKCDAENVDLDHLGCLFADTKPNGGNDCVCNTSCSCNCGLPDWLEWDAQNARLVPTVGNVDGDDAGKCFQFVVAVKDDSVSRYDGKSQRIVRLFRIAVGEGYGVEEGGFDTYVSQDEDESTFCSETTLLVSGAQNGREIALIRFDRQQLSTGKKVEAGELILHATTDLTDATLYYLEDAPNECSELFFPAGCTSLTWNEWSSTIDDNIFPVATAWDIKAGDLVRFDITDYLKLKRNKCGWDSHPYFEFAIASSDATAEGGFYSTEETGQGHHAPRLAFYFTENETTPGENTSNKCNDCSDNDCDGLVDDDDDDCTP